MVIRDLELGNSDAMALQLSVPDSEETDAPELASEDEEDFSANTAIATPGSSSSTSSSSTRTSASNGGRTSRAISTLHGLTASQVTPSTSSSTSDSDSHEVLEDHPDDGMGTAPNVQTELVSSFVQQVEAAVRILDATSADGP